MSLKLLIVFHLLKPAFSSILSFANKDRVLQTKFCNSIMLQSYEPRRKWMVGSQFQQKEMTAASWGTDAKLRLILSEEAAISASTPIFFGIRVIKMSCETPQQDHGSSDLQLVQLSLASHIYSGGQFTGS